jgi:hypothetical protein
MIWYQDIHNQLSGYNPQTHEIKNIALEASSLRSPGVFSSLAKI